MVIHSDVRRACRAARLSTAAAERERDTAATKHARRVATSIELPRVLTPAIATQVGVTRSRTRTALGHGYWQVLGPGLVLTHRDPPTRADWAEAGLALGGPSAALSG